MERTDDAPRGPVHGRRPVRRYLPAYEPFVAMRDPARDAAALDRVACTGDEVALLTPREFLQPGNHECLLRGDVLQMTAMRITAGVVGHDVVELGDADAEELYRFARTTDRVPFGTRTGESGRHVGIRIGGRLVALADERMRPLGDRAVQRPRVRGAARHEVRHAAASRLTPRRARSRPGPAYACAPVPVGAGQGASSRL